MFKQILRSVVPRRLITGVRSNVTIQRLSNRNRMTVGVGAGLRFYPGPSNGAYATGDNELPVQEALAACLKTNAVFYDIGANVGFFTVIGAKLVGPGGFVYAFEPVPDNAAYVRLNAALNHFPNVTVIQKAVSSETGEGELSLSSYSGGAALSTVTKPPDFTRTMPINLVSIDDLISTGGLRPPAVVKIDVEGAELDVLQGMKRTLKEFRPTVLYEIDDAISEKFQAKWESCERFLQEMGYLVTGLRNSYSKINWLVGHAIATPR